MLSFATCENVPVQGGRGGYVGGGLVEVEGRVVWGGYGRGGVYMLDEVRSKWSRVADGGLAKLFPITPTVKETGKSQKEADERLYEEAMSKGYVETSVTKCLILGAAGVGKTHLKHLLLQKDPPGQRVSTGVADNPVRAISFSLAGVVQVGQEEHDWFVVEDDQALLRVVGGTIRDGCVSMATSLDEEVSSFPKMTIHVSSDGAGAVHPDPTPARVNTTMDTGQQSRTASIEEELIHHINHSSDKKKLFGVKWFHFIDSGGQLQYHDILPLFIQKPAVAIFVLNLSEELSHQPTIEYYGADGKPVSRPYRSSLSHKQILQHCLGAMCSQDARPLIITVGTHRDAADRCSESIAEKSQKLKALLDAGSFCIVYNGEKLEEVIFAVNGKTPRDEDRHVAKVLREEIISVCPQPIMMPIAWFGLEVLLQRSSHDGILSLVECHGCAKRLHIEGDAFSAALHHLVHNNVFLHYPEVLPQTVFCDPQVVLTKVSEIVEYHHKLLYRPAGGVAAKGDLVKFRDHGLLSVELLNKFSKHYTEGLFTPLDLLKLLVSVGGIAMVGGDEGSVYLMPALLPHLDSGQVSKYCQPGTSLIIRPTEGCIPSGLFCCLVAQLLSSTSNSPWKVCMKRNKPLCLYRNCITFHLKHTTELVTLVDMFSYILLHIDTMSSKVCREVRGCVHSGIKTACGILKYQGVQFEDAFMCAGACCTSDLPHVAIIVSEKKWRCSIVGDQCGDLCEGQLMWYKSVSLDSEPSLQHLMEKVAAVIPHKYEMVGLQLGLTLAQLQVIGPRQPKLRGTPQSIWKTTQDYSGETQHQLALVDQDYPKNRMNDGKCDARGRLWCGTMGYEKSPGEPVSSQGTLYCYHGGTPSPILMGLDGKVVEWMYLVRKMEAVGSADGDTSKPVVIKDCGMAKPNVMQSRVDYITTAPPDGFDAVSVQNVGSTYIIVSWDLPTHSNGILINFS
ncbi:hypothetical protein EMCRGX_G008450 [Ephydatia muelleri]